MTSHQAQRVFLVASLAALLLRGSARAQPSPSPAPARPPAAEQEAEIRKALEADQASKQKRAASPATWRHRGRPGAPATRLVKLTERVVGDGPLPAGRSLLFRSDHGADENWSIFQVDIDGKNLLELTPGEKLNRDHPFVPDGKPDTMFYSARLMAQPSSSIYVQQLERGALPRKLYTDAKPGFLIDVNRSGTLGLFEQVPSHSENVVLVVDLVSGRARPLYPKEGKQVHIDDASFSADGRRVLVATDGGGEEALLLALDAETGDERARYRETRPPYASIPSIVVAKTGDRIALAITAGNHDEIRILDAATLQNLVDVKLPLGSGSPGAFSEDGKELPVAWSTPSQPTDVFRVDAATGRVTPLRSEPRPTLRGLPAISASATEIAAFDGGRIPINLYLPKAGAAKPRPVIVSYHGGPAGVSTIRWNPATRYWVSLGYAFVEPNVRGSSGFGRAFEMADDGRKRLDAFKDIESAGRWAASQSWADKNRLVVYGGSYGGYTTLIALTRQPDLWRAGVDLFGVVNMQTFLKTTSGVIREIFRREFGELGKDDAFLDSISPLRDVDKIVDPLFVYAGANDPRVPLGESDQIVDALRKKGVPVEYMVKANEGHSLAHRENQIEFFARAARFLETELARPERQRASR